MRYNIVKVQLINTAEGIDVAKSIQQQLIQEMINGPDPDYPTTFRIEEDKELTMADLLPDEPEPSDPPDTLGQLGD